MRVWLKPAEGEIMEFQLFKFWSYDLEGYKGQIQVFAKTKEEALVIAKKRAEKLGMILA